VKVAIIPARGGSMRIPGKNIKPFAGKPIMGWVIEAALESRIFDRVIVSTDDEDIARLAIEYGAEAPFVRPAELSDDLTGILEVVQHAIGWLRKQDISVEYVCCILATAPFLRPDILSQAFDKLIESGARYAFSVTDYPFPIQRAIRIDPTGRVEALWPENINARSQDLESAYHDAGQFYWGRIEAFERGDVIFSSCSVPIKLPRYLVQDIDTVDDWKQAELMFNALRESGALPGASPAGMITSCQSEKETNDVDRTR
jgi:pseudaminic acid cytidylyltransferase